MGSIDRSRDYQVAITLDGQWILTKQQTTKLIVQHPATGIQERVLDLRTEPKKYQIDRVNLTGKSLDGNWLILGFTDNTFTEWYLPETYSSIFDEYDKPKAPFLIRAISSNNRWALRETKNGSIQIQDLFDGKIIHRLSKKDCINIGLFSSLSNATVLNTGDSILLPSLHIWNFNYKKSTKILAAYSIELSENNSFTVSFDAQLYVAGLKTGVVEIYELQHDRRVGILSGHPMSVTCVAISPDNRQVVSGSEDGTIKVWNLKNSDNLRAINFKLDNQISTCAIHPKENLIIVGDDREQIHVFEQIIPNYALEDIPELPEHTVESSEPPTIISKKVHLQGIPGDNFFFELRGFAYGPGNLSIELYNQNRLVYEFEQYIPESKFVVLPWIYLPPIPWEEDLNGFVMLQPPEGNDICMVHFTVNCLIKDESVLRKYKQLQQQFTKLTIEETKLYARNLDRESHLIEFLQFQENLFGVHHSETKKTIDGIVKFYNKNQADDTIEIQAYELKKQEIERIYKEQKITIAGKNSWANIVINENNISRFIDRSYLELNISPEKIIDSESQDTAKPNLEEVSNITAIPLGKSIEQELEELQSLISALNEPDINRLEYLGKAWKKFKHIVEIIQIREGCKSFISIFKQHNQFALILQNPRNFPYLSATKILTSSFTIALLSSTVSQFTASGINRWIERSGLNIGDLLVSSIVSTAAFCAGSLIASWLSALVVTPLCIKADIFNQNQSPDTSKQIFTIQGFSEEEGKQLGIFLLIVISFLLICCSIPFLLLGTMAGGVWGANLGTGIGMGFGIWLKTNKYWFLVLLCTTTTWIGDFTEWLFKRKRTRPSNVFSVLITSSFTALFGGKKYIGSILWFLLLWGATDKIFPIAKGILGSVRFFLKIVTTLCFCIVVYNYFSNDLFLSVAVRASSGALIATSLAGRRKTIWFGALTGGISGIFLSANPPLEMILWFVEKASVIVVTFVLGIIGLFTVGGIVSVLCFSLPVAYSLVGIYLLFKQITEDFQHKGYTPVLGILISIAIILLGIGFGLITSFLF